MKVLVTGSAGHLGEALMRTLDASEHSAIGADLLPSPHTRLVGSITDRGFARECVRQAEVVLHVATLHQPHLVTHLLPQSIDRVYVNERARAELGWQPRHDFARALERLQLGVSHQSALALAVGSKGYHRKA